MNPAKVLDARGRRVTLAGELARGGEGVVLDIAGQPGSVAKLYLQAPDRDKAEKVTAMVAMATDRLLALSAWPTATLHGAGGHFVGFVMPKLAGHRPVFQVYGPKLRLKQFPRADWRFLVHTAGNVARAFGAMHEFGLVVGDVNQNSLFVAKDATVRFIDTDSMQVARGGRLWPCEVGVSTHQPPEMQGVDSYRGIVRTANHDCFGLAVIIFQLLCMGRHPFAGRFSGPGEPPGIPEAIAQARYAFSADVQRTRMSPPPGSLPVSALPRGVQALFEAAFAPGSAQGGRPVAEQWTSELAALGQSLRRCTVNAAHWFGPDAKHCPWCDVEAGSGVALFPALFVAGAAGGGIVLLWQEIQAVPEPPTLPKLAGPVAKSVKPSPWVRQVARRLRVQKLCAAAVLVAGVAIAIAGIPDRAWSLAAAACAVLAAGFWWTRRPPEVREVQIKLAQSRGQWATLEKSWAPGPGSRFAATQQGLAALKRDYDGLPGQREREMSTLTKDRRQQQLLAHLESFEIATAKIAGVGRAKVATLLSYGIETAADVDPGRVAAVPGFGPKTAASLLDFRTRCEASFRFDPARAVAHARVAAMDGMLAQRRDKITADLAAGLGQLRAMAAAERRHREALEATATELRPIYAQALADARALGLRG